MKKLLALLSILLVTSPVVLAAEEPIILPADIQKATIKNSYLTGVMIDNKDAKIQEVTVTKSFLVFVKIKVYPATIQETK